VTATPELRRPSQPTARRGATASPVAEFHYADLVEQLFREYEDVLSLHGIVELVSGCRHDLAGSPPTAMPELLERLARYRLAAIAAEHR
jgi:hypothetical protein